MTTLKKSLGLLIAFFMLMGTWLYPAFSQDSKKDQEAATAANIKNMVESKSYVFEVQSVSPMSGHTKQLSYGYHLKVSKDTIISDLPYFGRATTPSMNSSDAGIQFTSTNFEYTSTDRKKGGWEISIKPKDQMDVRQLSLTIYDDGTTSLQVTSNSRQSISYKGYLDTRKEK